MSSTAKVRKAKKTPPKHTPEEKAALGQRIADAREAAKFTQEGAADELDLVKQTLSSWENGRNVPDALWLRKLARLYSTPTDVILGLSATPAASKLSADLQRKVLLLDPPEIQQLENVIRPVLEVLVKAKSDSESPYSPPAHPSDTEFSGEIGIPPEMQPTVGKKHGSRSNQRSTPRKGGRGA